MEIFKINSDKPNRPPLKLAAGILLEGGIVVYPTETLYGLGANAMKRESVIKIYKIKGRRFRKPLSVAFHSLAQAKRYVKFNSISLRLAKMFLPGPLTIVLPMKRKFPRELTGSDRVGIRIPDNKIALEFIKMCKLPITATSANISGDNDPYTAEDVTHKIKQRVDLILDGGKCRLSRPSTVIEVVDDKIKVLRVGAIEEKVFDGLAGI